MALDILAGIVVVGLAGLGFRKGALAQILNLIAVALAFAAARPAGAVLSLLIYGQTSLDKPFLDFGMTALGGVVIFAIATVVGVLIERFVRDEDEDPSKTDRLGGAAIGAVKGVLVVYLLAAGVLSIEAALEEADPGDELYLQESRVVEVARILPRPWEFAPRRDKAGLLDPWLATAEPQPPAEAQAPQHNEPMD